ncbi:putative ankyrin repeat protein RBE_0220 [Oscarella lobularis]|uniref:putative ankyrin repeat protein RBE_0220 n=1 Tax=Oscarella lobularis TaxID=121494 RepID=UPI00331328D6
MTSSTYPSSNQWHWSDDYWPDALGSIHYTAGREFESAEEAEEFLSREVAEGNSEIDQLSQCGRTPLHFACEWGSIYGVKWLVAQNANVNVKDDNGLTPYLCSCTSSVDTLKKMVVLEDSGCDVPPISIILAAQNQYSSLEKAQEVLHHLAWANGISVDSQDDWMPSELTSAPLYSAFTSGSIFGVQWLISNGANVTVLKNAGEELYESVCTCSVDTLEKLRILEEIGCQISPRAIVFAAGLHFALAEEAFELLEHFVNKKE